MDSTRLGGGVAVCVVVGSRGGVCVVGVAGVSVVFIEREISLNLFRCWPPPLPSHFNGAPNAVGTVGPVN